MDCGYVSDLESSAFLFEFGYNYARFGLELEVMECFGSVAVE